MIPPCFPAYCIESGLVVIDEIQKLLFLLDEVHSLIESSDIRLLLTGSSARRLREQGTNLLGGRSGGKELYSMVWPEIKEDERALRDIQDRTSSGNVSFR